MQVDEDANMSNESLELIQYWLTVVTQVQQHIKPSAIVIGKIWARLFFNLNSIAEEHGKNIITANGRDMVLNPSISQQTNAAKIMRFNVISLLHAVLFEESHYHISNEGNLGGRLTPPTERSNPNTTVKVFYKKLENIWSKCKELDITNPSSVLQKKIPIFYSLVTCPLLMPFLLAEGSNNSSDKLDENRLKALFIALWLPLKENINKPTDSDEHKIEGKTDEQKTEESSIYFDKFAIKKLNSTSINAVKKKDANPQENRGKKKQPPTKQEVAEDIIGDTSTPPIDESK